MRTLNDFIDAMIQGHDKTEYRWLSGNVGINALSVISTITLLN